MANKVHQEQNQPAIRQELLDEKKQHRQINWPGGGTWCLTGHYGGSPPSTPERHRDPARQVN